MLLSYDVGGFVNNQQRSDGFGSRATRNRVISRSMASDLGLCNAEQTNAHRSLILRFFREKNDDTGDSRVQAQSDKSGSLVW